MYRVTDNARSKKTAALICDGLEKCLETKPLDSIRIKDIFEQCYVSRSTFYRLFDSIIDVIAYKCDCVMTERVKAASDQNFKNKTERVIYIIDTWMAHPRLIKAIIDNHLEWIIFQTHSKNIEYLRRFYPISFMDEKQSDYFLILLSSIICSSLAAYIRNGGTELEAYKTVGECLKIIANTFDAEE